MFLTPAKAAEMIVDAKGHGYMFYLVGTQGAKQVWVDSVNEELLLLESDRDIVSYGKNWVTVDYIGDISNSITNDDAHSVAIKTTNLSNREEVRYRGLAITHNLWFVPVDNFLSFEDEKQRPIIHPPVKESEFDLPKAIIVDLDGTLVDSSHRRPYGSTREEILQDKLNRHVEAIVRPALNRRCHVLYVTARGNEAHEVPATLEYLKEKNLWNPTARLFHRNVGDNRDDVIVKYELFNAHIRNRFEIELVLDDRPRVVRMWHALGLPVLANQAYLRGEF